MIVYLYLWHSYNVVYLVWQATSLEGKTQNLGSVLNLWLMNHLSKLFLPLRYLCVGFLNNWKGTTYLVISRWNRNAIRFRGGLMQISAEYYSWYYVVLIHIGNTLPRKYKTCRNRRESNTNTIIYLLFVFIPGDDQN